MVLVSLGDLYYANETGDDRKLSTRRIGARPVVTGLSQSEGMRAEDARTGDPQQAIALLSAVQQIMAKRGAGDR